MRSVTYIDHSDEQLLSLVKGGDQSAFDELYERYGQKMFSFFFRMLWKNKEMAEDYTQDLFIKIMNNASVFEENRSFSTWLYSIANNMCKNEYRKKEVRDKHLVMAKNDNYITEAGNPDLKKFKEALQRCINDLSEEKRSLYLLRFQESLSIPEISAIIKVAEGTVKSRIFYLLKEIRETLKEFKHLHIYP